MIEIRIHGRGGQGVVKAAEILALAGFYDGKSTQALPRFGPERRGAPVEAYVRFDETFIQFRTPVYTPDGVVVFDARLLSFALDGLKQSGFVILNSKEPIVLDRHKVWQVDANAIAQQFLGKPIVNSAMLGACAKAGLVSLESLLRALKERFAPELVDQNVQAAQAAYKDCR